MRTKLLKSFVFIAVFAFTACTHINIDDEQFVMKDIQGTWVGYEKSGHAYRHIKVNINDNKFYGWLHISDSVTEPKWAVLPNEAGTFSISSVLDNISGPGRYRSIIFSMAGRCCTDNSLTAKTLTEMIVYTDRKGLSIGGSVPMTRVQ